MDKVVGASGEGQFQTRQRQGFKPRGYVPQQPTRFVPVPYEQPLVVAKNLYQEPNIQQQSFRPSPMWNSDSSNSRAIHKRQKPWEDNDKDQHYRSKFSDDEDQWRQDIGTHEKNAYRYNSFKPHHELYNRPLTTPIPIIRLDKEQSLDGSYKTSYETGNNIVHEETGFMKPSHASTGSHNMLVQKGSYSYKDHDGNIFTVKYTADDQGFRAEGDHFPTPPPIPPEIQRGLDIIYEQIKLDAERRNHGLKLDIDSSHNYENDADYSSEIEPTPSKTFTRRSNQQHGRNFNRNVNTQPSHIQNDHNQKYNNRNSQQEYNKESQSNLKQSNNNYKSSEQLNSDTNSYDIQNSSYESSEIDYQEY